MPFEAGNSGNPGGRRKEKIFADALRIALNEEVERDEAGAKVKVKKVRVIADRLVSEAMAGESWAIQQVMDRMDGKPAQTVGGDDDLPPIRFTKIIREMVEPDHKGDETTGDGEDET